MDLQLIQVLFAGGIAFSIAYFSVPVLRKIAYHRDLYDKPDNQRKLHDRYVPSLGGVAIFMAFFIGFSISGIAEDIPGYPYMAAAITLLFFTGLKDDIVDLSARVKLLVELVVAMLLIFGSNIYISNFYGVFGVYEIPYWVSVPLTAFTFIVVINAYNLIDGIDGLAAGIGILACLFFGTGFFVAGEYAFSSLSFVLLISLVAYLRYNYHPAQIFMGDTGSLVVGGILSVLAIKFIGLNEVPQYQDVFGATSSVLPIAILAFPLFDTITVFYKRIRRGDSPFTAGRDHIHHSIMECGFGQKATSIILYSVSFIIPFITLSFKNANINVILVVTILSMFLLFPVKGTKREFLKKIGFDIEKYLSEKNMTEKLKTQAKNQSKTIRSKEYTEQKL